MEWLMFFFRPPLASMVFQWFCFRCTTLPLNTMSKLSFVVPWTVQDRKHFFYHLFFHWKGTSQLFHFVLCFAHEAIKNFNCFEDTITIESLTIGTNGFSMVFNLATIACNGFLWLWTQSCEMSQMWQIHQCKNIGVLG